MINNSSASITFLCRCKQVHSVKMSVYTKRSSSNFSFLWISKIKNRIEHRKGYSKINFRNLDYHQIRRHESGFGIIDYDAFFRERILADLNAMLQTYNNNIRPFTYQINLDLQVRLSNQGLVMLVMDGLLESSMVSHFNLNQRFKLKRTPFYARGRRHPWHLRGQITLQMGFGPCRHEPTGAELETNQPVYIEYTYN